LRRNDAKKKIYPHLRVRFRHPFSVGMVGLNGWSAGAADQAFDHPKPRTGRETGQRFVVELVGLNGWYWLVLAGAGWCWLVLADAGWCWLVLADDGWCWPVLPGADRPAGDSRKKGFQKRPKEPKTTQKKTKPPHQKHGTDLGLGH
jgi:hypothetical protein